MSEAERVVGVGGSGESCVICVGESALRATSRKQEREREREGGREREKERQREKERGECLVRPK